MKKILKVVGKILKWYVIGDVIVLAIIGIGTTCNEFDYNDAIMQNNVNIIVRSFQRIKSGFKRES